MTTQQRDQSASPDKAVNTLREAALDVVWRQWRTVGAQAATARSAYSLVDPEALVLISLALVEYESRLGDLVNDWVALNSDLLSIQRVKNLRTAYQESTCERLSRLAEVALYRGKDSRWRSLVMQSNAMNLAHAGTPASRGNKTRAVRPRFAESATLMLQLRLGFGVSAKADMLAYLLAIDSQKATVREIAAATSYTVAAVRRATEDMAAARLINVSSGQPAAYRADHSAWTEILGLINQPPRWRSWQDRFAFVAAFLAHAQAANKHPTSAYAAGVKDRELLETHRSAFERDSVMSWNEHTPVSDWASFTESAVRALAKWMVDNA